jgi:succinate dehydrogenase/fumarate reductase flavoprotein subunit
LRSFIDFLNSVKKDEIPNLACTSKSRTYNKEWIDALELQNMVQLLEMAAQSALLRTESRGVHYREDHPNTDNDRWLKESIVKRSADGFEVTQRPVTVTTMAPPTGAMPYLDFVKKMMESRSDTGGKH